jgi:hypothetical protein
MKVEAKLYPLIGLLLEQEQHLMLRETGKYLQEVDLVESNCGDHN